ncbi:ABC transporter permease [Puerhibacterium puerhi]|uniref:ABC transporter permease n=1 Tax=Puerhibacterium puerhi TaxID=2692623 RepID=UPI00135876F0|nr:ABC transporter permease [Puerhibacterium puerhi]
MSARSLQRALAPTVLALLLVIVVVTMSTLSPYFLSVGNVVSAINLAAPLGIIAVGMTFVILIGGIDLSVASTLALSAVSAGLVSEAGSPAAVCIAVPLIVGALCGLANGWLVSRLALPAIVVTLATMAVYGGLALALSGGRSLTVHPALAFVGLGTTGGLPTPVVLWVVVVLLAALALSRTALGEYLYATGTSASAARYATLRVRALTLTVYATSGVLSGLAALLVAGMSSSAKSNFGTGFELLAVTVVVVGGAALTGGRGTLWGTAMATVFIALLNNGMSIAFVPTEVQTLFVGVTLIVTASIYRWTPPMLTRLAARRQAAPSRSGGAAAPGEIPAPTSA